MAGEIEEYINSEADHLPTSSISFGRFEAETLSWERRSSFSHNRYLEEVEKYSTPGSVTEKKAYFEAHFKKKALQNQSSLESQSGAQCQTTESNILDHERYLVESENHDHGRHLHLSWYDETSHALDDLEQEAIGHEQEIIDCEEVIDYEQEENPLSNCPVEVTTCNGAVSESADELDAHGEQPETQSANEAIQLDKDNSQIAIENKPDNESGNRDGLCEDNNISSKRPMAGKTASSNLKSMQKTSPKVKVTVGVETAKPNSRMGTQNLRNPSTVENSLSLQVAKPGREIAEESAGRKKTEKQSLFSVPLPTLSRSRNLKSEDFENVRAKVRECDRSEKDPRAKKGAVISQAISEKSKISLHQSANRPKRIVSETKDEVKKSGIFNFTSDKRAEQRKEFYMKLEEKHHAREVVMNEIQARAQEESKAEIKQFRRSLNFKATPMPSFYCESMPSASNGKKNVAMPAKSSKMRSKCTSPVQGKASAQENSREPSEVPNHVVPSSAGLTSSHQVEHLTASEGFTSSPIPDNEPDKTGELGDGSQSSQPSKKIEEGKREERRKPNVQQQQGKDIVKRKEIVNKVQKGGMRGSKVMGNVIKSGVTRSLGVHVAS